MSVPFIMDEEKEFLHSPCPRRADTNGRLNCSTFDFPWSALAKHWLCLCVWTFCLHLSRQLASSAFGIYTENLLAVSPVNKRSASEGFSTPATTKNPGNHRKMAVCNLCLFPEKLLKNSERLDKCWEIIYFPTRPVSRLLSIRRRRKYPRRPGI
jgi:hypothetical protein